MQISNEYTRRVYCTEDKKGDISKYHNYHSSGVHVWNTGINTHIRSFPTSSVANTRVKLYFQANTISLEKTRKNCVFVCNPVLVDITVIRKNPVPAPIRQ